MLTAEANDDQEQEMLTERESTKTGQILQRNKLFFAFRCKQDSSDGTYTWHKLYILLWEMVIVMTA